MTRPVLTPSNHAYNDLSQSHFDRLMRAFREMFTVLRANGNGTHCYMGDDMAAWFRTLGFLDDPDFIHAAEPYQASLVVRAKLWRIYHYCWAVRQSPKHGTKIDLGCYDGKTVHIAQRYMPGMTWAVFDAFTEHPAEDNKQKHGEELYREVIEKLEPVTTSVHKGLLPEAINAAWDWRFNSIGFIHLDLNDGDAEVKCLERLWDKVLVGGIILLDDFGWARYRHSHDVHKAFFKSKGHDVLENPTGQGLVVRK